MTCPRSMEAGAYVLGALSPAQRLDFQQHLATCPSCRAEVADLAGIPGLLGRLDEVAAIELDQEPAAPSSLLPAALTGLRKARQRQRWQQALVAAAVVLLALSGVGAAILRGGGGPATPQVPGPQAIALSPMRMAASGDAAVQAQIALVPDGTGTRVEMHCYYLPEYPSKAWKLSLVVYPKGGGSAGPAVVSFTAQPGSDWSVTGRSPLPPDQIDRVELLRGDGTTLLTYWTT